MSISDVSTEQTKFPFEESKEDENNPSNACAIYTLSLGLQFLSSLLLGLLTSLKSNPGRKAGAGHRESGVEMTPRSPECGMVGRVMTTLCVTIVP